LDVEEEEAQPAAVDHGHEKKILRLSKKALELAHLRLGHASRQRIVQLARSGALTGFSLQTISHEPLEESACESCLAGNWPKGPLDPGGLSGREALLRGPSSAKLPEAGRLVGCDLYGPINFETIDGTRFIMALYDVATGFWMMHRLPDASSKATAAALRAVHTDLRTYMVDIRTLRLDHGTHWEGEFKRTCAELCVARQHTSGPRNQQQNGGVESNFGVHASIARRELHRSGLSSRFYVESIDHAGQTTRRSLSPSGGKASRMEQMIGVKPDFRELHPFGCEVKVRSEPTSKAVPDRAISALFMGVSNGGVRVFNVNTGKMLICRFGDCRIYDHVFPCNPTPGRELKLKYDAYRGGREEMDAADFELPLVIDDAMAADGRWKGRYAPGDDSAMQMIMDARTSLVRSGRTLHQEFNDALRLGRLDGQLCDRQ
jgi:transposase InsO family protein